MTATAATGFDKGVLRACELFSQLLSTAERGDREEISGKATGIVAELLSSAGSTNIPPTVVHRSRAMDALHRSFGVFKGGPAPEPLVRLLEASCPFPAVRAAIVASEETCNLSKVPPADIESALPLLTPFTGLVLRNAGLDQVPRGVCALRQLTFLDLSQNRLDTLPHGFLALENLRTLRLFGNRFDAIPSSLASLPLLEKITVRSNPLRQVPAVVGTKSRAILDYLKEVSRASEPWKRVRLMVVGQEAAGKTSLLRRLRGMKFSKNLLATNGIDIQSFPAGDVVFSAWDFAGQDIFLPTHQFFLGGKAVYLLLFDLRKSKCQARLEYWVQQVRAISRDLRPPPVILVGTHADELESIKSADAELCAVAKDLGKMHPGIIATSVCLSNKTGLGLEELNAALLQVSRDSKFLVTVPTSWARLHDLISSLQPKRPTAPWSTYLQWCSRCGLLSAEGVAQATDFLQGSGLIMHFGSSKLADIVILDPQFVGDAMAAIVSFTHGFGRSSKGMVSSANFASLLLKKATGEEREAITELLLKFEVIHFVRDEHAFFIPFLLPPTPPSSLQGAWKLGSEATIAECIRVVELPFVPAGIIGRMISNALSLDGVRGGHFWREGMIAELKGQPGLSQKAIVLQHTESRRIIIHSRTTSSTSTATTTAGGRPSGKDRKSVTLFLLLLEAFDTILEGYYPRLMSAAKRFVVCPHCLSSAAFAKNPAEFSFEACVSELHGKGGNEVGCEELQGAVDPGTVTCINDPRVRLRISDIAPDIGFTDMTVIEDPGKSLVIERKLGEGGFGTVYAAVWQGKLVAVKELRVDAIGADENPTEAFAQFQKEVFIMSTLHSPYLVQLFAIALTPPRMVMEFLAGGDLNHKLYKAGTDGKPTAIEQDRLPWLERYRILIDVARGMRYLQSIKPPVLHRDLRSANTFLTGSVDGPIWAKVADFGLSRRVGNQTKGSLPNWEWLAPEVWNGSEYDESSDVYSFGLLLLELSSLSPPYSQFFEDPQFLKIRPDGTETQKAILQPLRLKHAITEGLRPTIPSDLDHRLAELITACLRGNPRERPKFPEIERQLCLLAGF